MKRGDLLIVHFHSYPDKWKNGEKQKPHMYIKPELVIYLARADEKGTWGWLYYLILTSTGVHKIYSMFCTAVK